MTQIKALITKEEFEDISKKLADLDCINRGHFTMDYALEVLETTGKIIPITIGDFYDHFSHYSHKKTDIQTRLSVLCDHELITIRNKEVRKLPKFTQFMAMRRTGYDAYMNNEAPPAPPVLLPREEFDDIEKKLYNLAVIFAGDLTVNNHITRICEVFHHQGWAYRGEIAEHVGISNFALTFYLNIFHEHEILQVKKGRGGVWRLPKFYDFNRYCLNT